MNISQSLTDRIKFNQMEIKRHKEVMENSIRKLGHSKRQIIKLNNHYARLDELTNLAKSLGIKIEEKFKPCGKDLSFYHGLDNEIYWKCGEQMTNKIELCPECQEKYNLICGQQETQAKDKTSISSVEALTSERHVKNLFSEAKHNPADTQDKENKIRIVRTLLDEIYRIVKTNPNIFNRLNYSVGTKDGCFGGSWTK